MHALGVLLMWNPWKILKLVLHCILIAGRYIDYLLHEFILKVYLYKLIIIMHIESTRV